MTIDLSARFSFFLPQPADLLLQFEAAQLPEQAVSNMDTRLSPSLHFARVPAQDGIGERIWIRAEGDFQVSYTARAEITRQLASLGELDRVDPHQLPGEAVQYILPSLYCPSIRLQSFALSQFGGMKGGEQIEAMREWIAERFTYEPGSSTTITTALDSFIELRGICRDYAHVLITLARASGIPARYASVYAPRVEPQDFHAVAEVFLANPDGEGGAWHLVDATGMARPGEMVKIGVGRDAADVSFLTCFGPCEFGETQVSAKASS